MRRSLVVATAATVFVAMTGMAAWAGSDASLNAKFMNWPERSDVVHIIAFWPDDGPLGNPPAVVSGKAPITFGFEWGGESVEQLQADIIDDPNHDIFMSIDGGPAVSVKDGYQEPFVATPGVGPRWSWDHDGDGLGDGNGNGIGDWSGPAVFWRYEVKHLAKGTHTFEFTWTEDGGGTIFFLDLVTAEFG